MFSLTNEIAVNCSRSMPIHSLPIILEPNRAELVSETESLEDRQPCYTLNTMDTLLLSFDQTKILKATCYTEPRVNPQSTDTQMAGYSIKQLNV